jgi:peroxiredoxin
MRIVCLLISCVLLLPGLAAAVDEGEKAPSFAARSLEGDGNISLAKHRGKVVYLDFWASWCVPCLKAVPAIEELRKELPASAFQVIAVNLDRDLDKARSFLAKHSVGYPSATDPEGRVPEAFGLETMPTSYIIDRDGVVRHIHEGFRPSDIADIRKRIRTLIDGDSLAEAGR